MALTKQEKEVKKIIKETVANMSEISVYKPQFDSTIRTYAEMKQQYNMLMEEFYKTGCKVSEEYTNKAGFTNVRKTAVYLVLESLRKDTTNLETILGLNPTGLKRIKGAVTTKVKDLEPPKKKKLSALAEALIQSEQT